MSEILKHLDDVLADQLRDKIGAGRLRVPLPARPTPRVLYDWFPAQPPHPMARCVAYPDESFQKENKNVSAIPENNWTVTNTKTGLEASYLSRGFNTATGAEVPGVARFAHQGRAIGTMTRAEWETWKSEVDSLFDMYEAG